MNENQAQHIRSEWGCLHLLVRWLRHAFGQHTLYCKAEGLWDIDTGARIRGHHCTVTKWKTKEKDHVPSSNAQYKARHE